MYILVAFVDGVEVEPIKREVSKVVYTWRNKDWWFPPIMAKKENEKTDWLLHKWEIVIWLKLEYAFLFFLFRHFIEHIYIQCQGLFVRTGPTCYDVSILRVL